MAPERTTSQNAEKKTFVRGDLSTYTTIVLPTAGREEMAGSMVKVGSKDEDSVLRSVLVGSVEIKPHGNHSSGKITYITEQLVYKGGSSIRQSS